MNLVENPSAGNGIGSRAERDLQKLRMRLRKEQLTLSGLLYLSEKVIDRDPLFTLIQVQDALLRIEFGAYGTCIACGGQIESGRLEMVPWLAYCAECHGKYQQVGTGCRHPCRQSCISARKEFNKKRRSNDNGEYGN